jgi:hypothetical protein
MAILIELQRRFCAFLIWPFLDMLRTPTEEPDKSNIHERSLQFKTNTATLILLQRKEKIKKKKKN